MIYALILGVETKQLVAKSPSMKTLMQLLIGIAFCSLNHVNAQVELMNYTDLQFYLPTSIENYKAGEPGGSTMEMEGMSFSSAEIEFTGSDGKTIKITLMDYSLAQNMFKMATAAWGSGINFEDDESKIQTFKISEKIAGWEEFRKKENEAQIAIGIGERFFLSIEANEQKGIDFIKEIALNMELDELASK